MTNRLAVVLLERVCPVSISSALLPALLLVSTVERERQEKNYIYRKKRCVVATLASTTTKPTSPNPPANSSARMARLLT